MKSFQGPFDPHPGQPDHSPINSGWAKVGLVNTDGPLYGKSILFTGTLSQMTREEAEKRAAAAGASLASGVSKHLSILVVGEKAGSKLKKAQALETVEIWSEGEFLERVGDAG